MFHTYCCENYSMGLWICIIHQLERDGWSAFPSTKTKKYFSSSAKEHTPDVMTTDWNLSNTGFIAMEASIQLAKNKNLMIKLLRIVILL